MNQSAPIKNTVGEGFTVEEKVVAWLACQLLAGIPWTSCGGGMIKTIDCQARQNGWFFDDTVVTVEKNSVACKCGCSIKSFSVFGPGGAPADFRKAVWHQWENESETAFKRARDNLAIITAHHLPDIRDTWFGLTEEARVTPPEIFAARYENRKKIPQPRQTAFASLENSTHEGGKAHTPNEVAELLGKLCLIELDFEHSASQSVGVAISMCQQALTDPARARAQELWDAVLAFSAEVRRKGGRIDLPSLLNQLAHRFPLKSHPSFASDWALITSSSRDRMTGLASKLGGIVTVPRTEIANQLEKEATGPTAVPVLGGSGYGKSVIARDWANVAGFNAVWLTPAELGAQGGIRSVFGLQHAIAELFCGCPSPTRLVLDGMDKCFEQAAFDEVALVLRAASAPECKDRWRIVLTCCPEDWTRVVNELTRREVQLSTDRIQVGPFTDADLKVVAAQLPALFPVLRRPHLSPILRWPKALDIIAANWKSGESTQGWATESSLSHWYWDSAIRKGPSAMIRDRIARKLAVQLGDQIKPSLPLDDFPENELNQLRDLAAEGHVEIDQKRRSVRFSHDLIADWARQSELQAQGENVATFLKGRLTSPLWHRSIRFHGLDLLESNPDNSKWEHVFQSFSSHSPGDDIAQNLLIEAPIFAVEQHKALTRLWPILVRDKGVLFRRFMKQFLQVATVPDEQRIALVTASSPELALHASTLLRLPWWPYWVDLLNFLEEHASEATEFAAGEIADVCLMWLPYRNLISAGMQSAAKLAVTSARAFADSEARDRFTRWDDSTEEKICAALFAASYDLPKEVTELALALSGRNPASPRKPRVVTKSMPSPVTFFERGEPRPWPDGPRSRCSPAFRKAFMNSAHSAPLLAALPDVAAEVMFAVLLSVPYEFDHLRDTRYDIDEHGFDHNDFLLPSCFWTNGPFLTFLRECPKAALPAIVRLVNFATDRSSELPESLRQQAAIVITVAGKRRVWKGHQYSYLWHKGHVFGPRIVCCALFSLEKWLYELLEKNEPIDEYLSTILKNSRSIALAPVLICIGKRKPELILGSLRSLIEVAEFYWIEELDRRRHGDGYRDMINHETSKQIIKLMGEWFDMPHRKRLLRDVVLCQALQDKEWKHAAVQIRAKWLKRIKTEKKKAPPWLKDMVVIWDLNKWKTQQTPSGVRFVFDDPSSLPQPGKEAVAQLERTGYLTILPLRCAQILGGKTECSVEQLEDWWSHLPEIRRLSVPTADADFQYTGDTLCAIAAVAVVCHPAWLAADGARLQEALNIFKDVYSNPPRNPWFFENETTDYKWDNFIAWAIPMLWCENPTDPFLSDFVATLVLWKRYLVIERVMLVAAGNRDKLGSHFDRLLAHAIRFSPARDRFRHNAQAPNPNPDDTEYRSWLANHIKLFRTGKTMALPTSWLDLAEPVEVKEYPKPTMSTGLDLHQIFSALTWAIDLTKAKDSAERLAWLRYHRESLLCSLIRIKKMLTEDWSDREDRYDRNTPFESEGLILARIGIVVAQLNPGEDHRQFWEPIFVLGCKGSGWVDKFIFEWLLQSANHNRPAFVEQWRAMLEFAEACPAWKAEKGFGRNEDKLWHYLLGFAPFTSGFWAAETAPALVAVRDYHERWAAKNVDDEHEAEYYIYFLLTQGASPLRVKGLVILHNASSQDNARKWYRTSSYDAIASLLNRILAEHWDEVAADPVAKDAFMALTLKLVSIQHSLGAGLLSAVSSRMTISS